MACIALFAPTLAMATTELVRAIHYEGASVFPMEANVDHKPLSMSWVVVTGNNGARRLRMRWASAEGC